MKRHLLSWLLVLLAPLGGLAASPLDTLLENGSLSIDSRLQHDGALVPGQYARMVIEIGTSTWFTGGTRIRLPEVPGLVILQTEQFAANASETRDGTTWVLQRWTIDLYPQRPGEFRVPAMELSLQVNGGDLGNISGSATSPPLAFSVSLPAALEQAEFWVASPDYTVTQTVDRELDRLEPGDAFERRITFRAEDVPAMMLPALNADGQDGLAAYPAPPVLDNSSNRGQRVASREQSISYVAEQPGRYVLPAEEFFWWDTRDETLKVLSIPALEVTVTGQAAAPVESSSPLPWRTLALAALAPLVVMAVLRLLLRHRPWQRLAFLRKPLHKLWRVLLSLRQPALPRRLNPDSSAGD
ncbi:hypothetical protein DWB85_11090 [Seongchinamella sediminis]|uniref:Protein BatD n=1 Tax=Seongchinamella sediminis TaxID=2283635 RepID=A0A3L7E0B1_9GAMM|nr:BatD family protein [Seongchinamella sediminis]RLQ21823.1 hypothetical protein DWB85_11090 [Seongchinamella sediminis]